MTKKHEKINILGGCSNRFLLNLFVLIFLCAVMVYGALFVAVPNQNKAKAYKASEYTYGAVSSDDLYNGTGGLNGTVLNALSAGILGTGKTAGDLAAKALSAGTSGIATAKEITVKFGGLQWIPTYLSTTKDGRPILTLWLSGIDTTTYPKRSEERRVGKECL